MRRPVNTMSRTATRASIRNTRGQTTAVIRDGRIMNTAGSARAYIRGDSIFTTTGQRIATIKK